MAISAEEEAEFQRIVGQLIRPEPQPAPTYRWHPDFHSLLIRTIEEYPRMHLLGLLTQLGTDADQVPSYHAATPRLAEVEPIELRIEDFDLDEEFAPTLWLLNRIGDDGIKLTQAGYLPPSIAREYAQVFHADLELRVFGRRSEADMRQLAAHRKYLQKLGLLRVYRGNLKLTKAGARARLDSRALWHHLVDRFAALIALPERDREAAQRGEALYEQNFDRDVTALTLLAAATSFGDLDIDLIIDQLNAVGWHHVSPDGVTTPVHIMDVTWGNACPAVLFWFMGPREERHWSQSRIRPAAVALAHAALMRGVHG